ncbi:hypothetical protein [Hymenobacter chitinivorans]|uniref:Uncharacterized protein n=1 Tax=Hymenobacter chitinivorans DSM 11115 TaxID=1121954 RepID=A0A2M9BL33_9BACT|nr:hypothetical protein [Hymenobacter chitinivorans]PJJ58666.1 hypothetical protein CLV45_0076 [Hymenobacter chitinivorans DSM 11115]
MSKPVPNFHFRQEELLPLARLLHGHVTRDLAEFKALLPQEYGPQFLPDYAARLAAAEVLVSPTTTRAQGEVITQRIKSTTEKLPLLLDHLDARVRRAQGLTVPAGSFGTKAVRQARSSGDVERLESKLKSLLQNLDANQAALQAKGHPAADTQALRTLYADLTQDTTLQDLHQSTQPTLTADNMATLNHLYALMQEVLADGKSLYGRSDKVKARSSYTLRQLLKRVRTERGGESEA